MGSGRTNRTHAVICRKSSGLHGFSMELVSVHRSCQNNLASARSLRGSKLERDFVQPLSHVIYVVLCCCIYCTLRITFEILSLISQSEPAHVVLPETLHAHTPLLISQITSCLVSHSVAQVVHSRVHSGKQLIAKTLQPGFLSIVFGSTPCAG